MVARTRISVTLYVHCLSCFIQSHPQANLTRIHKIKLRTECQDVRLLQTCDTHKPRISLWVSSEIKSKITALVSLFLFGYGTSRCV